MPQRVNTQGLNTHRLNKSAVKQKGMTFIEVLIALVIMVTGILGAVAMQATAKKGSFDAMQRSLASSLAQDIVERMRGNSSTTLALYGAGNPYGTGKITSSPTCNSTAALCTPAQMVTHDLYGWEQALMGADVKNGTSKAGGLVDATACVNVNVNAVTVVITWQGKSELVNGSTESCGDTSSKRRQVLIEAFIF